MIESIMLKNFPPICICVSESFRFSAILLLILGMKYQMPCIFSVLSGFPQRLENLENENGDGKVIEFCDQSWNFTNFASKFYQICIFFVSTNNLRSNLESPHFLTFFAKCCECNIGKRDGHGKRRNGHGKVMEKYFVKSVGTLIVVSRAL